MSRSALSQKFTKRYHIIKTPPHSNNLPAANPRAQAWRNAPIPAISVKMTAGRDRQEKVTTRTKE